MLHTYHSGVKPRSGQDTQWLREEIAHMKARVGEIGYDGDCACEKAMARFYCHRLASCRARLQRS